MKKKKKLDPLKPSLVVLVKLGSAVVHAKEAMSIDARPVDKQEFNELFKEPDLAKWINDMTAMALLPVMRGPGGTKPL